MISEPQISLNCPLSAFSAFFAVKKAWNPAWRQALLGRPAIAGCSPMLPRCGTSASVIRPRAPQSLSRVTFHVSHSPPSCVSCRFVVKTHCSRLRYSVTSLFNPPPTTENPHEVVNPCNCNNCNHIFFHKLATFDFARCPRPSAVLQTVPKSSTIGPRPPSRFTFHVSRSPESVFIREIQHLSVTAQHNSLEI